MIDPFWHRIAEAYGQVFDRLDLIIKVELGTKSAEMFTVGDMVVINISHIDTVDPPTLIVP